MINSLPGFGSTPSESSGYFLNMDAHNIASGGQSFWDEGATSVGNTFEGLVKGVGLGIASGINHIYNTVPTVANWFGADLELSNFEDVVADYDNDLAQYYQEHKTGIDVAGFVIGSFVPGLGAVNILRKGQKVVESIEASGSVGSGTRLVTGLLRDSRDKYIKAAKDDFIRGNNVFSAQQASTLKAFAAGAKQSVLEATAFEAGVLATMYNAPMLENQTAGDLAINALWGIGLGGTIGTAIEAVRATSQIKRGLALFDSIKAPYVTTKVPEAATAPSDAFLFYARQYHESKSVPLVVPYADVIQTQVVSKLDEVKNSMFAEAMKITGKDEVLARTLQATALKNDLQTTIDNLWEVASAVRPAKATKADLLEAKAAAGTLKPKEFAEFVDTTFGFLITRGPQAGQFVKEMPSVRYLGDELVEDAKIVVNKHGVQVGKTMYKQQLGGWDVLKATAQQTELRKEWLKVFDDGKVIPYEDIPRLEVAYQKGKLPNIQIQGGSYTPANAEEFLDLIANAKKDAAFKLSQFEPDTLKIAQLVNTSPDWLTGAAARQNLADDLFQDAYDLKVYNATMSDREVTSLVGVPSAIKLTYRTKYVQDLSGNDLKGMVAIKSLQQTYKESAERVAAANLGEDFNSLRGLITERDVLGANRLGAGAGLLSFASASYGTIAAKAELLGQRVLNLIVKEDAKVDEALTATAYRFRNNPAAVAEYSLIEKQIRGSTDDYFLAEDGLSLVSKNKKLPPITMQTQEVQDLMKMHVELNAENLGKVGAVRASQGLTNKLNPKKIYFPPPNPRDVPFFAFVIDPTVTGTGHSKMLYAATQAELDVQIAAVRREFPEFNVRTRAEAEDYYKSRGQYEYERTLHDNYVDSALRKKGISERFFPQTDGAVMMDNLLRWHKDQRRATVRSTVEHLFETEFEALRRLGKEFTDTATSKQGPKTKEVISPYHQIINTAMGRSPESSFALLPTVNRVLEEKVGAMYQNISRSWSTGKKDVATLDAVYDELVKSGWRGANYDALLNEAVNTQLPKAVLSNYVRRSNSILATFALRMDPLNALNNALGNNILLNTELKSLLRKIEAASPDEWNALTKIKVPGTTESMFSHTKLLANAIKAFHSDPAALKYFQDNGFLTSLSQQYRGMLDDIALRSTDGVAEVEGRITRGAKAAGDWVEKATGNRLTEEFNRFVSAHVMKQMTDVAVAKGLMNEAESLSYINTFVNRTQGNFLSAQRPTLFQGPIGQAIGLFQTYQFNLIQNLFRYIGEGGGKDVLMLGALQGTIFGMNGMPAFQAINNHLIGTASGNENYQDVYTAAQSGLGKDAADWMMYGFASNFLMHPDLKLNMYTRGDVNPRHLTVVPTSIQDIPFIKAHAKVIGGLIDSFKALGTEGDTTTMLLQGLQTASLSRPLTGLFQTAQALDDLDEENPQVLNVNTKGNIIATNDLYSLTTLARIAGGKPLDEAVLQDKLFRSKVYASHYRDKLESLGKNVKSTMFVGDTPSYEQTTAFMEKYVALGGDQKNFNKWMLRQFKNANTSQAEQLASNLNRPYAQALQEQMGGYDPTLQE